MNNKEYFYDYQKNVNTDFLRNQRFAKSDQKIIDFFEEHSNVYSYGNVVPRGYIEVESDKQLRNNKIFKLYYKALSKKYQKLLDAHIESLSYRLYAKSKIYRSNSKLSIDLETLFQFYAFDQAQYDTIEYINGKRIFANIMPSSQQELVAAEFMVNPELTKVYKAMIYDNEQVTEISQPLINGSIISNNEEAIAATIDLLKAAKLAEGLRETVVSAINRGSVETFKRFLTYIHEENLSRFASVKNSIQNVVVTRLENPKNSEKLVEYVYECLVQGKTSQYLSSENPLQVSMALFSMATVNIDDANKFVTENFSTCSNQTRGALIKYLNQSGDRIDSQAITTSLKQGDENYQALCLSMMPNLNFANDDDKREYITTVVSLFNTLKKSLKYSFYPGDGTRNYLPENLYNDILQLVYEFGDSDMYTLAYQNFGKFAIRPDILYTKVNGYRNQYTYLNQIYHSAQRAAIIEGLARTETCYKLIEIHQFEFTEDEYFTLAKQLKSKRGELRDQICFFFKKADPSIVVKMSEYLISQKKAELKTGGLSIIVDNLERISSNPQFNSLQKLVSETEFPHETEVLKQTIIGGAKQQEAETIFEFGAPTLQWDSELIKELTEYDFTKLTNLAKKWYQMFRSHVGEEFEVESYDGVKWFKTVGTDIKFIDYQRYGFDDDTPNYQTYYYYQEFINELDEWETTDIALLIYYKYILETYIHGADTYKDIYPYGSPLGRTHRQQIEFYIKHKLLPPLEQVANQIIDPSLPPLEAILQLENFKNILKLIEVYYKEHRQINIEEDLKYNNILLNYTAAVVEFFKANQELFPECFDTDIEDDTIKQPQPQNRNVLERLQFTDDNYAFDILQNLVSITNMRRAKVSPFVYAYFVESGVLDQEKFINILLNPELILGYFALINDVSTDVYNVERRETFTYYRPHKYNVKYYDTLKSAITIASSKLVDFELSRTDSVTKYSKIISRIQRFYSTEIFIKAIDKMKKVDFVRTYSYSGNLGIKDVFSRIVERAVPEQYLTDEQFQELVKAYKITDKKILEACLYNSNFTKYAANYLQIPELEMVLYYFIAHSIDTVSEVNSETKRMIRRYSEFELIDFVDGKFDLNWFKRIEAEVDKDDYKAAYNAAKYIMGTTKRKRGQYFADAYLGNLDIVEVEAKIADKRNQDMLLCLGLIPLGSEAKREQETLRRYKLIQQFIKDSKQFGAQRRATETRRANIAISNLAANYGIEPTRFTWIMEAKLIDESRAVFEPTVIDEITVHLSLDNVTNPTVVVIKNDKKLKSVPAKYKKDPHIVKINEVKKDIKDQFSRARKTLEQAMIDCDTFDLEQLRLLTSHPVIKQILKDILFTNEQFIGFYKDDMLVSIDNQELKIGVSDQIRIAHSADFEQNDWVAYQNYIIANQIVQPFKQVFRELYLPTADELTNKGFTNRFAGYQVSGRQAFGVLNTRDWIVNDYDGFEKVNHAHNLRVDLYCYANWRNANEVEEPTLERIEFLDNKTNKLVNLGTINKIFFSEVMRDLDLVVSVAYVGGVDPLLNHTTIEMRTRILEHNLKLFKIDNYEFKGQHIKITGSLGNYTIHLGSGIVMVEGKGMLPMVPVHSQKRGHLFLPFVDQDPKTAEIITKVLMLAEDNKLNDPSILQFIK